MSRRARLRVRHHIPPRRADLRATQRINPLHAIQNLPKPPRPWLLARLLREILNRLPLVQHVILVHIEERRALRNHPRERDGGDLLVFVGAATDVRVRAREPDLAEGGGVALELLPQGGTESIALLVEREGLEGVLDAVGEACVVEGVFFRSGGLQA